MEDKTKLSQEKIENRIYTIRGKQVMLDRDLAELYQVETRILNQAVKRNKEKFPDDFMFQLNKREWNVIQKDIALKSLTSQIVILKNQRGKHRKYLPYVFTEQGVAGLSGVLNSKKATEVHIAIMRTFVQMRKIAGKEALQKIRLSNIEDRLLEHDQKIDEIFDAIEQNELPKRGIFFNGQVFDAYQFTSKIIRSAQESIILIDNYIDETTLTHLSKKNKKVEVLLLSKRINAQLKLDVEKANQQYGNFTLKRFKKYHDRFLIIDKKEVYHIGASLKDLEKSQ